MDKREKLSQAKTKGRGRPKKRHADDELLNDSNNNEILHLPKPRGRPRKIPKLSADDVTRKEILPARPRGRLRKYMQQELNGSARPNDMMRVVSNNSISMVLSVESEQQNLPEVLPSYASASEREIFTRKEVIHSPLPEADMPCSHIPETIALPWVVLFLAHNGKVAWDVKWRPKTSSKPEDKQLIGYLAVLLGGKCPSLPLSRVYTSLLELKVLILVFLKWTLCSNPQKIRCGDRQCIPITVEWSRSSSCDLILAGCHDGTVALWKFSTHRPSQDANCKAAALFHC